MQSEEYELTYLASSLPEGLSSKNSTEMVDVYIPEDGDDHPRLRLRKKGNKYEITKKIPISQYDASAHTEMTIELNELEFKALESSSAKKIVKTRYFYKYSDFIAEIDVFKEDLEGLVLVDFEFKDRQQMALFKKPDFCLVGVTQELFIAGGKLAGKKYADLEAGLGKFNYKKLSSEDL